MTKVTLTLDSATATKLRALCHAQGRTASEVVAEWVERNGESFDDWRDRTAGEKWRTLVGDLIAKAKGGRAT